MNTEMHKCNIVSAKQGCPMYRDVCCHDCDKKDTCDISCVRDCDMCEYLERIVDDTLHMNAHEIENNTVLIKTLEGVMDKFLNSILLVLTRYEFYKPIQVFHDNMLGLDYGNLVIRTFGRRQFLFDFRVYESEDGAECQITYKVFPYDAINMGELYVPKKDCVKGT